MKIKLSFIMCLILMGCSSQETASNNQGQQNVLKSDVEAPSIAILGEDEVVFTHDVFNWNANPEGDQDHLPYFDIHVGDVDSSIESLKLSYAFVKKGDQANKQDFRSLAPHSPKKWRLYLSDETVGRKMLTFLGKQEFTLHIKATDGKNESDVAQKEFTVINEEVSIKATPNLDLNFPNGMHSVTSYFEQDHDGKRFLELQENAQRLLNDREDLNPIVIAAYVIKNHSSVSRSVAVDFNGTLKVEHQESMQTWNEENPEKFNIEPIDVEIYSQAEIKLSVYQLENDTLTAVKSNEDGSYDLTPYQNTKVGLAIVLSSTCRFLSVNTPNTHQAYNRVVDVFGIEAGLLRFIYSNGIEKIINKFSPIKIVSFHP